MLHIVVNSRSYQNWSFAYKDSDKFNPHFINITNNSVLLSKYIIFLSFPWEYNPLLVIQYLSDVYLSAPTYTTIISCVSSYEKCKITTKFSYFVRNKRVRISF